MRGGRLTAVIAIMAIGCGASAPRPKSADTRVAWRYQLHNGMTVVLVPDPVATLATVLVRYNVGAVDDPAHQEGVAHLAAHVMNDQRLGGTTLATQVERVAVRLDVEPRPLWTSFYSRTAPEHLDAIMKLEAVRLASRCEHLEDAMFDAERENVAAELATNGSWRINRNVGEAVYPASDPMRRAYAADAASVRSISKAQTCEFIDRHYAPGNAMVIVTGPIAPAELEHAVTPLASVPARSFEPPAKVPARTGGGVRQEVSADVAEPTLAIAWAAPVDLGEHARATVLLDQVAAKTHAGIFGDERSEVLWTPLRGATTEAKLAEVMSALKDSVSAVTQRVGTRRTGRMPVRRQSEYDRSPTESFERVRRKWLISDLARLDDPVPRVAAIAREEEIETIIVAHGELDGGALRKTLDKQLDPSLARIVLLRPDGSRPPSRAATLVEPVHELRRPLDVDLASAGVAPSIPPSILSRAKEVKLANGLTVILAPTSAVPIAHVRLVFAGGTAGSPLRRVANAAITAFMNVLLHGTKDRDVYLHWHTDWDSSVLWFDGSSRELQRELEWFVGLRSATGDAFAEAAKRALADAQRSNPAAEAATQRDDAFRARLFGTHPYGTARADDSPANVPTLEDTKAFASQFLEPDNATLIVTGQFDVAMTEQTIRHVFEPWQGHGHAPEIAQVARTAGSVVAVPEAVPWVELRVGWSVAGDADYSARMILGEMIDRLSPRARAVYEFHRSGGEIGASGVFERETAAKEIAALRDAIVALGDGSPASRALFAAARRSIAIKAAAGPASSAEWSQTLARLPALGHDLAWRQKLAERTAAVQYADVQRIVTNDLVPSSATWMLWGPEDSIAAVSSRLGPSK